MLLLPEITTRVYLTHDDVSVFVIPLNYYTCTCYSNIFHATQLDTQNKSIAFNAIFIILFRQVSAFHCIRFSWHYTNAGLPVYISFTFFTYIPVVNRNGKISHNQQINVKSDKYTKNLSNNSTWPNLLYLNWLTDEEHWVLT